VLEKPVATLKIRFCNMLCSYFYPKCIFGDTWKWTLNRLIFLQLIYTNDKFNNTYLTIGQPMFMWNEVKDLVLTKRQVDEKK